MKLGVNIDHVATLRQVRHAAYPDPVDAARLCAEAGAHSLTVHLREDRRHIQDRDVAALKKAAILPLNLEMGNAPEIVRIALDTKPEEACLVPERRQELTTEGGLDVVGQLSQLRQTCEALRGAGVVVSLFIEPDPRQIEASAKLQVPYVELHTGKFCAMHQSFAGRNTVPGSRAPCPDRSEGLWCPDESSGAAAKDELKRLIDGARVAHGLGLKVNAGHGINLANINDILRMPHLDTLNIGHSIVARAVFVGMKEAVAEMLRAMAKYRGGEPE